MILLDGDLLYPRRVLTREITYGMTRTCGRSIRIATRVPDAVRSCPLDVPRWNELSMAGKRVLLLTGNSENMRRRIMSRGVEQGMVVKL